MRFLHALLVAMLLVFPQANMLASNEPFYKNIDYSNIDLIGKVFLVEFFLLNAQQFVQ